MASYSYTFASGDTVTPTKLNNARTISNIVNADVSATADIAGSKIAPTFTSQVTVPDGSAAAPSIRITTEPSGLYRVGGALGVSVDGEEVSRFQKGDGSTYAAYLAVNNTSLPAALFGTNASSSAILSGSNGIASGGQIRVYGGSHATKPNFVELTSGNTVRMTLNNSGLIGIGIPSPVQPLHVNGTIHLTGTTGSTALNGMSLIVSSDGGSSIFQRENDYLRFGTNNTERMRIDAIGNIGIGAAIPTTRLHVAGASGAITLQDSAAAGDAAVTFLRYLDSTGTRLGYVGYGSATTSALFINNDANDSIIFATNAANRVWISAAGYLGINDGTPAYHLDVNGDANVTGVLRVDATQVVTNRRTGWAAPTGTATRTTFATSTVTTAQLAERVKALIDDLTTHGLIGA